MTKPFVPRDPALRLPTNRPLWFEDFPDGAWFDTPGMTLTEASIIDFAQQYDPQSFHLDRDAAERSVFAGLIASGFQTLAISFRLFMQTGVIGACSMGGPAMDDLRWLRPVRPGDTLRCRVTAREPRPSRSRPDRGSLRWQFETFNQHGETVMTVTITSILAARPTADQPIEA